MQQESQNSKAIISTLVLHAMVLGACYFIFIAGQIPTETIEQGGIVINYGTSDEGMGTDYTSTDEPAIGENINNEPIEDPNRPNSTTASVSTWQWLTSHHEMTHVLFGSNGPVLSS